MRQTCYTACATHLEGDSARDRLHALDRLFAKLLLDTQGAVVQHFDDLGSRVSKVLAEHNLLARLELGRELGVRADHEKRVVRRDGERASASGSHVLSTRNRDCSCQCGQMPGRTYWTA